MRTTGRFTVTICVHLPEDLVCAFLWCGLILGHLHHRGDHLVDSLNTAKAASSFQKEDAEHEGQRSPSASTSVTLAGEEWKDQHE